MVHDTFIGIITIYNNYNNDILNFNKNLMCSTKNNKYLNVNMLG